MNPREQAQACVLLQRWVNRHGAWIEREGGESEIALLEETRRFLNVALGEAHTGEARS